MSEACVRIIESRVFDVICVPFLLISIMLIENKTEGNYQQLKHDDDQSDGCMKAPFCSCQAVCLSAERSCSILSPPQSLHHPSILAKSDRW